METHNFTIIKEIVQVGNYVSHWIYIPIREGDEIELLWGITVCPREHKEGFGGGGGGRKGSRHGGGIKPRVETAKGGVGDDGQPLLGDALEAKQGFWGQIKQNLLQDIYIVGYKDRSCLRLVGFWH